MKNTFKLLSASLLSITILFFASCGNKEAQKQETQDTSSAQASEPKEELDELAVFKFQKTIGNIPNPSSEMYEAVSTANADFDANLVNTNQDADKYKTSVKQSLAFGVYSVDLIYYAMHDKVTDATKCSKNLKTLSEKLDMQDAFNSIVNSRDQNSIENKDTLIVITNQIFDATDSYLKNNNRVDAASLVLAGSWIESQNIILNVLNKLEYNETTSKYFQRIYEQNLHLANLVDLLNYKNNKDASAVLSGMDKLLEEYKKIKSDKDVKAAIPELVKKLNEVRLKVIS